MNVNPRIAQSSRNSKAMITGAFVRNAWYVAIWGDDLPREQVVGRTILNEAVALFRKADGSVGIPEALRSYMGGAEKIEMGQ